MGAHRPWPKDRRRRGAPFTAVAAAAVVVAVVCAVLLIRGGADEPVRVAGGGPGAVGATSSTIVPAVATTLLPGQAASGAGATDLPAAGAAGSPGGLSATGGESRSSGLSGGISGGDDEGTGRATDAGAQEADGSPPSMGTMAVEPATIWETSGDAPCPGAAGAPPAAAVTVMAEDPSGIGSVILAVAGPRPASLAMTTADGRTYGVTVGPFPRGTVPVGGAEAIPLSVRVTDGPGNAAEAQTTVVLRSCP